MSIGMYVSTTGRTQRGTGTGEIPLPEILCGILQLQSQPRENCEFSQYFEKFTIIRHSFRHEEETCLKISGFARICILLYTYVRT